MDIKAELRQAESDVLKARADLKQALIDNISQATALKNQIKEYTENLLAVNYPAVETVKSDLPGVPEKEIQSIQGGKARQLFDSIHKEYDKKVSYAVALLRRYFAIEPTGLELSTGVIKKPKINVIGGMSQIPGADYDLVTVRKTLPPRYEKLLAGTNAQELFYDKGNIPEGLSGYNAVSTLGWIDVAIQLAFMIPGVEKAVAKVFADLYLATAKLLDPEIQKYQDSVNVNATELKNDIEIRYEPGMKALQEAVQYLGDKTNDAVLKLQGEPLPPQPTVTDNTNVTQDVNISVPGLSYRLIKKNVTPQGIYYTREALSENRETLSGADYYIKYH